MTLVITKSAGYFAFDTAIFLAIAKASSWLQSEVKMMINCDAKQAAHLLTDGCNMGVKSLCEYKNQYKAADEKSVKMCEKLCDIETKMTYELQSFL